MPTVEEFRERAAAWLAANMEMRDATVRRPRGATHRTVEQMVAERGLQAEVYAAGYAGISWPVEYGGQGLTKEHEAAFHELAEEYRMPNFGPVGDTSFHVVAKVLLRCASPEFLREHGRKLWRGEELYVQLFSEPGAGSDLAGVTTRATRDGDRWILNGSKIWTSGAVHAAFGLCLARSDWDVPKHRGLTWFVVPMNAPGMDVQPIREINGDDEFCQEFLDDVEIPDTQRVGGVNDGWAVAHLVLMFERGGGGDSSPRSIEYVPEAGFAPEMVRLAGRLGRLHDPVARQLIARSQVLNTVQLELLERLEIHFEKDQQRGATIGSLGKLTMGTFDPMRAKLAMELGGRAAVSWDPDVEQESYASLNYLNSRVVSVSGGSNEMQRNIVGERLLGLPREPSFDTNEPFTEVLRKAKDWK